MNTHTVVSAGSEPRVLHLLGKFSLTDLQNQSLLSFFNSLAVKNNAAKTYVSLCVSLGS